MPNIRQYNSSVSGLNPNDRAASAAAQAGNASNQALSSIGKDIGSAVGYAGEMWNKQKAREEKSTGSGTYIELFSNLNTAWNETAKTADPNDPTTAGRFMEEQVNPILDAWESSFTTEEGQAWAASKRSELQSHLSQKTIGDQSSLAGVAAVQNLDKFKNIASTTALNDPTAAPMLRNMTDDMVKTIASSLNLSAVDTARLQSQYGDATKKEITLAEGQAIARANPDAALAAFNSGKFGEGTIDASETAALVAFAERQKSAKEVDARAAEVEARRVQKEAIDSEFAQMDAAALQPDGRMVYPRGYAEWLEGMAAKGASPERVSAARNAYRQSIQDEQAGTFRATNKLVFNSLYSRVGRPSSDPEALTDERINRLAASLSTEDRSLLLSMVPSRTAGDQTAVKALNDVQEAARQLKSVVDTSTYGKGDPAGAARYQAFFYAAGERFRGIVASGKTPQEAAAILNDPANPQGLQGMLREPGNPYTLSNKDSLQALTQRYDKEGGGAAALPQFGKPQQRKIRPGESLDAYLKDIGK